MTTIKDKILIGWFALSSFALAVLYLLYDRHARTITELKNDAQRQILGQKLIQIQTQAQKSDEDAINAFESYEDLKRRHADLFKQYGIGDADSGSEH